MDHETEIIKQQMEDTRESLSEKLEALEQHVMTSVQDTTDSVASTVESVKDAVHDTVSSVRETVSETVDTVKEAFDIGQQVERHPWPMVAGATLVGFVIGRLLVPAGRPFLPPSRGDAFDYRRPEPASFAAPVNRAEPSWFDHVGERFAPALDKLKELALSTGTGLIGEMILNSVGPSMKDQVAGVIDEVAAALGTKPPHLDSRPAETPSAALPRQDAPLQDRVGAARGNGRHS